MKFGRMKNHRRNRLLIIVFIVCAAAGATTFTLFALNENINLFYSPEQIVKGEAPVGKTIRAGGMVLDDSVIRYEEGLGMSFVISDLKSAQVKVEFEGILPDMFREGQGVIALGQLNDEGLFVAEEVLAKHDENYMPPEVADALKAANQPNANMLDKAGYE
jgi:cytochrome c-type biogenesis protein CcmE|tara:strand:+ start:4715 stop:5197 length:483 start_codon:yes stop_codon:yes gene_type:complete